MPRKKKEEPIHLKGYCPQYTQNLHSGQKYMNYLNLNDMIYLCSRKGYVGTEAPVFALWKDEVKEITREEFVHELEDDTDLGQEGLS